MIVEDELVFDDYSVFGSFWRLGSLTLSLVIVEFELVFNDCGVLTSF